MRRRRLLREAKHSRFLVTLKDGSTFDGLLVDADPDVLILANAHAIIDERQAPTKVDGRIWLPRENVSYVQSL